jgi:uncharacterized SAM-binding protein YcdF (DUF218 family)/lysophospholipase L1-like esterase
MTSPLPATAAPRRRLGFRSGVLFALACVFGVRACINNTHIPDRIVGSLLATDTPGQFDAIVVLGAGIVGPCVPNDHAVRRTLLGVRLWREGRGPVLVFTGGRPRGHQCAIGDIMAGLAREMGVPDDRIRVEAQSHNTHENAALSAPLLRGLGATRLLLVTDRMHMKRATGAFEHEGFETGRAAVPVYLGHADNVSMLYAGVREFFAYRFYVHKGWITPSPPAAGRSAMVAASAARGASAAAFDGRSIPPLGVARRSNIPDILPPRDLIGGRLARLDATRPFHHGLLGLPSVIMAADSSAAPPHQPAPHQQGTSGKVVILGASYAAGWTPAIPGVQVVNKGVTGQQAFELRDRFDRDVVAEKPRAVIIWGFINDVFRADRAKVDASLQRARASIEGMVAAARANGIEPILATEVTMGPRLEWSEWVAGWVGWAMGKTSYQEYVNGHVLATNQWLRDYAAREKLLLLDLQPVVSDAKNLRLEAYSKVDGSHLTPAGYEALDRYAVPILARHFAR